MNNCYPCNVIPRLLPSSGMQYRQKKKEKQHCSQFLEQLAGQKPSSGLRSLSERRPNILNFLLKCLVGTSMVSLLDVIECREGTLANGGGRRSTRLQSRGSVCLVVFARSISDETGEHYYAVNADHLLIYGGNMRNNQTAKSLSPQMLNSSHETWRTEVKRVILEEGNVSIKAESSNTL